MKQILHPTFLLALFLSSGLLAQDPVEKIAKELQKQFEAQGQEFFRKAIETIGSNVKAAIAEKDAQIQKLESRVKEMQAAMEKRNAEIGDALKARDARIAELERKLDAAAKPPEPAAAKPPAGPTAFLGIHHRSIDAETRAKLNLKEEQGAHVAAVLPGGPAEQAGLKEGDIIIEAAGAAVTSKSLEAAVHAQKPGAKLPLSVIRGAEKLQVEVTLGDRAAFVAQAESAPAKPEAPQAAAPAKRDPVQLGVIVEEMEDKTLVVQEVEKDLTAAAAGLQVGDVIQRINGKEVKSLEAMREALGGVLSGDELKLELKRKDEAVVLRVVAGARKGEAKLVDSAASKSFAGQPAILGAKVAEEGGKLEVLAVTPDTAAAAFDFQAKDIIVEVDKKAVKTLDELKDALKGKVSGDKIDVVIQRGNDKRSVAGVVLGAKGEKVAGPAAAKPAEASAAAEPKKPEPAREKGYLGLNALELENDTVIISEIVAGGAADKAKLQKNDRIVKLNGVAIKNLDDMVAALKDTYAGGTISLVVRRGDADMEIQLTLEKQSS
jgi:S1-C subfamily serine protease